MRERGGRASSSDLPPWELPCVTPPPPSGPARRDASAGGRYVVVGAAVGGGSGDRYDHSAAQPNPSQSSQPREPVITRSRWHIWSTFQFELKSLWVML
ncbi:hypothetical protein V6N11_025665 [Hibiscus sabdariffa]|uniref:Uncharacterized protein n=1 Tax=Hibiscus sabdariffa TaxID=183260 RepID=A0ABR2SU90_9ROSI